MTELASIVFPCHSGPGYYVYVVRGTIDSYHPSIRLSYWRPTAKWAKARGDRKIRTIHRKERRLLARQTKARKITGYSS